MKTTQRFLSTLLMVMIMMATSPAMLLAQEPTTLSLGSNTVNIYAWEDHDAGDVRYELEFDPTTDGKYTFTFSQAGSPINVNSILYDTNTNRIGGTPFMQTATSFTVDELTAGYYYLYVDGHETNYENAVITITKVVPTVTLDKSALQTALSYINSSCDKNNPPFLIFNKYSSDYEESELYTTVKDDEGKDIILGTNGEIKIKLYVASIEHHVAPTAEATILAPADCSELFKDLTNIFGIIFYNFDTSNVTNMSGMFKGCSGVGATLDLSSFDTSKVTNMNKMFNGCWGIRNLTIGNFDMSSVDVENDGALYMFDCETLYTLTMKSLPYLVDGTFNSQFSGTKDIDWEEVPVVVNVELDDNSVVYTGQDNYLPAATSATYTRQMGNEWGTLVMPYNIAYGKNDNYKLYYLTDATVNGDEGTLTLTEYNEGTIAANTPMIVMATGTKNDNNKYYIQIAGVEDEEGLTELTTNVAAIDHNGQVTEGATTALPTGWKMNGTFESTNIQCGAADVYFIANGQFWKADVETSVAPFRAWFEVSTENSAPANLRIVTDDETEGIELIDSDNGTLYMVNGQCHDLMGRKTDTRKGLQIRDGRVIMVK